MLVFRPFVLLLLALGFTVATAQDFPLSNKPDTVQGRLMVKPPTIDGTINPDEWAGAATSSRSLVVISSDQPSGDKGQYWVGYDDKYVYIAARIILADPAHVRADEYRDNVNLDGDDTVTFYLDPFGNSKNFSNFTFNSAGGTQMRIAGGRAAKREWSGAFEARGRRTATGWEGEARIEWAIIPLPPAGVRDMKYLFDWYVSSAVHGVSFHSTHGDFTRTHTMTGVQVPNIPIRRTINALPYAYIGYNDENKSTIANAGLDVKTEVTDSLNAVVTVNPDFRNIENDILNLDFSNFERLPGESRPFFLEGSQFLATGDINDRKLFASQRVGSFDTGANFYGNLNDKTQIGVLDIANFGHENAFVASTTVNPDPTTTLIGAVSRLDRPGENNLGGNFEYIKQSGNYLFAGDYLQTHDEQAGKGSAFAGGYQYQGPGLVHYTIFEDISPEFMPRLGFAPETGFKGVSSELDLNRSYKKGPLVSSILIFIAQKQDKYDGGRYRNMGSMTASGTFRNTLAVKAMATHEHFLDQYNTFYTVAAFMPSDDRYRGWHVSHTTGNVAGAAYENTAIGVLYRPVERLGLNLRHQFVNHAGYSDQTILTMSWDLDRYQSIAGRLVNQNGNLNWFVSFKRSRNLGAEYFLIIGDPNANSFQKTLIFKVAVPVTVR
ncbi:MAG TPA: DUF5916 domain-containing protein [Fimbriimonadaceae bacterium]|nr:DUF5916 domain-containing protein [Fimbriimonadaceae bacterium]